MGSGRKRKGEIVLTKCTSILRECKDKYNGAGIYRLYDNYGKSYIGRTLHIQDRLQMHRYKMNNVFFTGTIEGDNIKIDEAVRKGLTFDAEILEKIPPDKTDFRSMKKLEEYYLELYGGNESTYNVRVIT